MYYIYNKNKERLLVNQEDYDAKKDNKEWFDSPYEANLVAEKENKKSRKKEVPTAEAEDLAAMAADEAK